MRRSFLAWVGVIAGFLVGATSGWLAHQRRAERDVASAVASEEFLARMFNASYCGIVLQVVDRGRLDLVRSLLESNLASAAKDMDELRASGALEHFRPPVMPDIVAGVNKARRYVSTHAVEGGTGERLNRALLVIYGQRARHNDEAKGPGRKKPPP
jgi:hypothetical protein